MPNVFSNPDLVAAESLMHFQNELVLANLVSREWEDKFGREGSKIGDQIRLRDANYFSVTTGNAFTPQNIDETTKLLVIDTPLGVHFVVASNDMALTFDRMSERYLQPAMRALANKVDNLIAGLYKKVPTTSGTYNTAPTALSNLTDARGKLSALGVPKKPRHFVLDPITEGGIVQGLSGLFQNQTKLAKQYDTGELGYAVGAQFHMDQNIAAHTVGALGGTPLVNGANQTGSSLLTKGWTALITGVLKEGDVLTNASTFAVNPLTGETQGFLREHVVTADVDSDAAGLATVPIYPPMTPQGALVHRPTINASPADNAIILIFGSATAHAGVVANQALYFQKDWATLCIAPQSIPGGTHAASMKTDPDGGGIGIRYVCDYDIDDNQYKHRFDINIGLLATNPDFALRLMTS